MNEDIIYNIITFLSPFEKIYLLNKFWLNVYRKYFYNFFSFWTDKCYSPFFLSFHKFNSRDAKVIYLHYFPSRESLKYFSSVDILRRCFELSYSDDKCECFCKKIPIPSFDYTIVYFVLFYRFSRVNLAKYYLQLYDEFSVGREISEYYYEKLFDGSDYYIDIHPFYVINYDAEPKIILNIIRKFYCDKKQTSLLVTLVKGICRNQCSFYDIYYVCGFILSLLEPEISNNLFSNVDINSPNKENNIYKIDEFLASENYGYFSLPLNILIKYNYFLEVAKNNSLLCKFICDINSKTYPQIATIENDICSGNIIEALIKKNNGIKRKISYGSKFNKNNVKGKFSYI